MAEELIPFTTDFFSSLTTVVDEEDLKKANQYSEKSLNEQYKEKKEHVEKARPPLDPAR